MAHGFSPDVERLIQDRMIQGGYASEDDVVRDALRALDELRLFLPETAGERISDLEQLRQEIVRGLEPLDRGEGIPAEEVFEELLRDLPGTEPD